MRPEPRHTPTARRLPLGGLLLAVALATGAGCATSPVVPRACASGLQGSFLQLTEAQLGYGEADWNGPLAVLRATGADTVILQFSGDGAGAYRERNQARLRGSEPVGALLAAAERAGMQVYLGLHADPHWPSDEAAHRLPPPLHDGPAAHALAQSCRASPACAGWYLPSEIDDQTWQDPARTHALAAHLHRASLALRALAPRPVVVAPFFTGRLDPEAHARWWGQLMAQRSFDVLALQDGVGTGRATPAQAAAYLRALAPVAAAAGVRLWTVVELFRQLHGAPHDTRPFSAESASFATVRQSLTAERPEVERAIGFSVLDYMNPHGSYRARRLYNGYATWCDRAAASPRVGPSIPVFENEGVVSTAQTKTKKGS